MFIEQDIPFLKQYDTKIIVNVCGKTKEDYLDVVERLGGTDVDMLEINISCPNVKPEPWPLDRIRRWRRISQPPLKKWQSSR